MYQIVCGHLAILLDLELLALVFTVVFFLSFLPFFLSFFLFFFFLILQLVAGNFFFK